MLIKGIFFLLLSSSCIFGQQLFGQTGTIKGTVKELGSAETLPGANVIIEGTTIGVSTDFDGQFELKNIKPGVYTLKVSFISYNEKVISGIEVLAGEEKFIEVELDDAALTITSVTIEGRLRRDRENVILLEQRKATNITQSIGAQELSRKGVGDVAAAVTKVTGVSKQEGTNNIFVRGLGDRYNSTTLNGLPIPSNNPEEKNITLSIFSADIVDYISMDKVYHNKVYGDFAGGNVNIVSKRHSGDDFVQVEVGSGTNLNVIDEQTFPMQQGPNHFGFYTITPPTTLERFDFPNSLLPVEKTPVLTDIALSAGKEFAFNEQSLSLFATAGFNNGFASKEGIAKSVNNTGYASKDLRLKSYDYATNTTGMLNAGYQFSASSSLYYNLLFINSSNQLNENYQGTILDIANYDNGLLSRKTFEKNTLFINQLLGEHSLNHNLDINWGVSHSSITSDQPDRIQNTFRGVDEGYLFGQNQITDNHRYFHYLKETEYAANASVSYALGKGSDGKQKGKITLGGVARLKEREFNATQFNFRIKQNMIVDPNNLDTYFNQPNLENDYFTIETFRGNQYVPNVLKPQEYGGTQIISGGYLNFEYNVTPKFTTLLGVRAESIYQDVRWNTQLDPRDRSDAIEKLGVLPSITTRYQISEKQNLRFAASKTYTLPQFKERALFIYEEVTQVKLGNPDLYASDNYNLDVKWELFPSSGEIISITGYGKYILNPINEVTISSATSDISFLNTGDWGYVAGVEFELRKSIYSGSSSRLNGGVNASYLHTDQMLDSDKISNETNYRVRFTHDKAKFSGASDWLVNADLTLIKDFNDAQSNVMVTLAYKYTSDNIYAIGTNDSGNIVNKAINSLDLVVKSNVNKRFSVSASLKNILDTKVERVQENLNGPITVMSYQMGVLASLKLGYRF